MSGKFVRCCFGMIVAGSVLVSAQGAASARESLASFFAEQFGVGSPAPSYAPPVWEDQEGYERPLVVRPHRRKTPRVAKAVEIVKGPTQPVSIYEDKTLRRGDAVMTAQGIRIFKGSQSLPYRDGDFVAISDAGSLSQNVTKALVAIDRVPRS